MLHLDGKKATDSSSICQLFSTYFNSVYSPHSNSSFNYCYANLDSLGSLKLTRQEVLLKLERIDINKGAGIDNIPPSVIHRCRCLLVDPLTSLFNESLETGIFPSALKKGFIIPLHKSKDINNVRNYRPITILPVVGKLFESLVVDKLNCFISKLIHPAQHGFMRGKSTVTNLLLFQEYVFNAFRKKKQVDAAYIDMAKAFDVVDHTILISKLKGYGISDPLLSWIASYLSDRSLRVKIGPFTSAIFSPSSGVPQGSLLGPCLFIIFVNDLMEVIGVKALKFADDLKLFIEISSPEDSQRLQSSLYAVEEWCKRNNMSVNPGKCSMVTFHRTKSPTLYTYFISNSQIPRLQNITDLGVCFSSDMGFTEHLNSICSKANKMLGFISRFSRGINNPFALRSLYCSLVRQLMEYASPVWSPYTIGAKTRLETLQRRFIRLVGVRMGYNYLDVPVETLSLELNIPALALRREVADVIMLWKIVNAKVQCPDLLAEIEFRIPANTRSSELFSRKHHATNYDFNSPIARFIRLGNFVASECDFFADSPLQFRKRATHVLSQPI